MFKRLTYGTTYAAVEHTIDADQKEVFQFLMLQKKQQELLVKKKEQFTDFTNVLKALENQKHLFLIVNNEHILSKEVEVVTDSTVEQVVQSTFLNSNLDDFYYEVLTTKTKSIVSIGRKNKIDALINEYQKKGIAIIGFSLGNLSAATIAPFVEEDILYSSNSKIVVKNKQIHSIAQTAVVNTTYSINDLEVSNNAILALSGVLTYYLEQNNSKGLKQKNSFLNKEFQQKRIFLLSLYGMLGFLLTVLLINFLLFTSYRSQMNTVASEVVLNQAYKKQLMTLQERVTQKEKLVKGLQSVSNARVSMYLDEIAGEIPNTMGLLALQYQPLQRQIKKNKSVEIEENTISITGVSKKENSFNTFISLLEHKQWVDKVVILNYGKAKSIHNQFEILIKLKHE